MQICISTVHITAPFKSKRCRFSGIFRHFMKFMEIFDCPAVGSKMSIKFPFSSQNLFHEILMSAAWLSISTVISAHNSLHIRLGYQCLKSRKVRFPHILHAALCIKFMADGLWSAVHCVMFRTSRGFHHRPVSLQTFHEPHAQT